MGVITKNETGANPGIKKVGNSTAVNAINRIGPDRVASFTRITTSLSRAVNGRSYGARVFSLLIGNLLKVAGTVTDYSFLTDIVFR